ncbi:MAG: 16S rRNA (cytosine(967)-C(5))-methyltransferase, partial [Defluviitaleaceae bacterium]|nr:16S rRNA (cytosine(967)-C(5))-methyltransferase [Defluviitaleaceae bacterium]
MKTERGTAIEALAEATAEAAYNNLCLKRTLSRSDMSAAQKAFVTELVNGSLRNLIYLDHCIGRVSKTPIKKMRPFILNTLRISAYQILFLDRTPNSAACNEAVKLVKARGYGSLSGFVNGVLRAVAREGFIDAPLAVRYSYPEWLINHFTDELGLDATARVCELNAAAPDVSAAVNTLRADADALCAMLETEGMTVRRSELFDDVIHL